MTALDILSALKQIQAPLIETRDIAHMLKISTHSAGKHLESLRRKNFLEKLCRGKWVVKDSAFDPLQVAEFLIAPDESYISLHTALFHHGMIEQVPSRIYSVTTHRSRVVKTPVGVYSYHHCNPDFFIGFEYVKPYLKWATPEKSLVDYFYFAPSKTRQFTKLPELEFSKQFSWKKAMDFCKKVPSQRTRALVFENLERLRQR